MDICFLVLLDRLAMEVRSLGSCVIATVFNRGFMLGVFDRQVGFSPCTVSAYLSEYDPGEAISPNR